MTDSEARASDGMRFDVDAKAFAVGLGDALRGVSKRGGVEVLRGVQVDALGDTVTLTGSDMELTISADVPADVALAGAVVVADPRAMLALVKTLTGAVTVSAEGDALAVVSWTGARYTFETFTADDFPRPVDFGEAPAIGTVDRAAFVDVLSRVLPAVSKDESRPVLCGAYVSMDGQRLEVAGTDSYRLAFDSAPGVVAGAMFDPMVIPGRALAEVVRIAKRKGAGETVAWEASSEHPSAVFVRFTVGAVSVTSRRIEGQYPNWRQFLPDKFEVEASIVGAELAGACKRVASIIPGGSSQHTPIRLGVADDGAVTVSWHGQDGAGASETLPTPAVVARTVAEGADGNSGPMAPVGFTPAFLADAAAFCGDTVRVRLLSPLRPAVFLNGRDASEAFHLLMPVRISG